MTFICLASAGLPALSFPGVGVNIQKALGQHYLKVQEAAEREMAAITLEDVWSTCMDLCKKDDPES